MRRAIFLVALSLAGCPKLKGQKPAPSASATIVSAPVVDASAVQVDAGPPVPAVDPAVQANMEKAKEILADIQWMVHHGVTVNRKKPGDGDVTTKCEAIEGLKGAAGHNDPEMKKTIEEAEALCAFEVPLLTASEALDHLRGMPSQASRILTCDAARRDLDKARQVKPKDRKLLGLDAKRRQLCNR